MNPVIPEGYRKIIMQLIVSVSTVLIALPYMAFQYSNNLPIDPFVMSLAFSAVGGSAVTNAIMNAREHEAKANPPKKKVKANAQS